MHIIAGFTLSTLLYGLSYEAKVPTKVPSTSQFYVWPANDTDPKTNNAILSQLKSWVVDDETISISQIGKDLSSVNFYLVGLTEDQATQLNETSTIGAVVPRCTSNCVDEFVDFSGDPTSEHDDEPSRTVVEPPTLRKRANDPGFTTLSNVPAEMVYISQPQTQSGGVLMNLLAGQYVQDSSSGDGAIVYMIDTGADPANPEFNNLRSKWRWMGPDYTRDDQDIYTEPGLQGDWPSGHGSSMLSKIGGTQFGTSKKATTVIVRLPQTRRIEDIIEAITWIIEDWKRIRNDQNVKVAVINMSSGKIVSGPNFKVTSREDQRRYRRWLIALDTASSEGLLTVTASGNGGGLVNSYPAMFAGLNNWNPSVNDGANFPTPPLPELLVVGATDNNGQLYSQSKTANFVAMTGPGVSVTVARRGAQPAPRSGTSISTASVSGLAAYWAALPSFNSQWNSDTSWLKRVQDLRAQLINKAYSRQKGNVNYPKGLWNGVTKVGNICGNINMKRDDSLACNIETSTAGNSPAIPSSLVMPSSPSGTSAGPSSPTTVIQVGKNPVMIGNLNGPPFYTAIVNALTPQCPITAGTVSNCSSSNAIIPDAGFVEGRVADTGELVLVINDSQYTSNGQRDGMIALIASTLNNSATGSNCALAKYDEGCNAKRDLRPGSTSSECIHSSMTTCTAADTLNAQITDGEAGIIAFMDVGISFKIPGENFICEDIIAVIDTALALVPEADPALASELGEISAICGEIENGVKQLPGLNPPG